jgi:cytochrome c553
MNDTQMAWALSVLLMVAHAVYAGPSMAGDLRSGFGGSDPAEVANREYDEAMALTPNLDDGAKSYLTCAVCHRPEGWGSPDGDYPQIAGQLSAVIIKQLADIRAHNRDNPLMHPFSVQRILGGPQELANVAAYVAQLPQTADNGKGPGTDLNLGRRIYTENCAKCHGEQGEGNAKDLQPAIAAQHYRYLVRQFDAIRSGRRKNADPKMTGQILSFTPREEMAVLDYTSRLVPPPEKLAKPGWRNPDFPHYVRPPMPEFLHPSTTPVQPTGPAGLGVDH